jgi:hypothetical protein
MKRLVITGQVPPSMILSKDRAAGIPWEFPLDPDLSDSSLL